ncbi:MAG TPA: hypothetical protein VMF31_07695 [Solirubrobacterales bacterium]|nr:hypothetical protein [Solirubrobacterales bacterium]
MNKTRNLLISIFALALLGLAAAPAAPAEEFQSIESRYKVKLSGKYTNVWQSQGINYPDMREPWSFEKGSVVSHFKARKPWNAAGAWFKGKLPGVKLPKFQFTLPIATMKADTRAEFNRKINQIPYCGGELGECDGSEPSGLKTETGKCRKPNLSMGADFVYDSEGFRSKLGIDLVNRGSLSDICGKKYGSRDEVSGLPRAGKVIIPNALEEIRKMNVGEVKTSEGTHVVGYISGDGHPKSPRTFKTCPKMDGVGVRECWTTEFKFEIRRVR